MYPSCTFGNALLVSWMRLVAPLDLKPHLRDCVLRHVTAYNHHHGLEHLHLYIGVLAMTLDGQHPLDAKRYTHVCTNHKAVHRCIQQYNLYSKPTEQRVNTRAGPSDI